MNKKNLAITAVFSAAAVIFEALPLKVPFPLLSYLTFDIAEIPIFFLLFYNGIESALVGSILLAIVLMGLGSFVPIGPIFKFLAVASGIAGAAPVYKKSLIGSFITSTLLRVVVMTFANYVLIEFYMPGFLSYVSEFFGFNPLESVMILTAIFNIIQNSFSILIAYVLYKKIKSRTG
ncbi:MAG: hypothetical protein RXO33_03530 [Nitrososphaeria archaeon]|jgi:riboflavin transporter FmnP